MGRLTTHVLDTALGVPAKGLKIELYALELDRQKIAEAVTNEDGRTGQPLLDSDAFHFGQFELVFYCGDYLDSTGQMLPSPKFLDHIPIRFGIAEDRHYHVPLLLSPFGYSTYRGS
jgi:5-hydroxyisourate hydrolase